MKWGTDKILHQCYKLSEFNFQRFKNLVKMKWDKILFSV